MIKEYFPTTFYEYDNIFDHKILNDVLTSVKNDGDLLSSATAEAVGGPEFSTNYYFKEQQQHLFLPIYNTLNERLGTDGMSFQLIDAPWYTEYGEHDTISPHMHDLRQVDLMKVRDTYKYSIIINLSNFGGTSFNNPNSTCLTSNQQLFIESKYGLTVLFPSNILHWVTAHRVSGRKRSSFSANGLLSFL
jgi:hypothetical protein